jgi:hypothetical protein
MPVAFAFRVANLPAIRQPAGSSMGDRTGVRLSGTYLLVET